MKESWKYNQLVDSVVPPCSAAVLSWILRISPCVPSLLDSHRGQNYSTNQRASSLETALPDSFKQAQVSLFPGEADFSSLLRNPPFDTLYHQYSIPGLFFRPAVCLLGLLSPTRVNAVRVFFFFRYLLWFMQPRLLLSIPQRQRLRGSILSPAPFAQKPEETL